jgi:hypothetical protein
MATKTKASDAGQAAALPDAGMNLHRASLDSRTAADGVQVIAKILKLASSASESETVERDALGRVLFDVAWRLEEFAETLEAVGAYLLALELGVADGPAHGGTR